MKIGLFAENYYPYICGISPILRTLLHRLKDEGHEVYLVTYNVPRIYKANKDNPQIILVDGIRLPRYFVNSFCTSYVFRKKKAAEKIHEKIQFDIIHVHGEYSMAKIAQAYSKKYNVPMVYTWHSLWRDIMYKVTWVFGLIAALYVEHYNIRRLVNASDIYTVPSMKVYKRAKQVIRLKNDPVLLPSGIQVEPFLTSDEKHIQSIRYHYRLENKKVILFLGRVSREKRILTIIRYMKRMLQRDPNVVVAIVGTGIYTAHIAKWAKRHHLVDSIIFVGAVMNRDTADFYHLANVFVSGSKMETQGLTYIEAMTSKAIVLAQNDPVLEGVINDGKNGFVFNNKKEFLMKLNNILANGERMDDIREAAREKGLQYSSDIYIKRLQEIYAEAIKIHQQKTLEKEEKLCKKN